MSKDEIVVLDTSTIINLIDMNCLEILSKLPGFIWMTPVHVTEEIHTKTHRTQLKRALRTGYIEEVEITEFKEMEIFMRFTTRFGESADSACLTLAQSRGWLIGSDDKAVKHEAANKLGQVKIIDTRTILEEAVRRNLMDAKIAESLCKRFFL